MTKAKEFLKLNEGSPSSEVKQFKAVVQKILNELDDISDKSTNQEFLAFNKKVMTAIRGFLNSDEYPILKK